MKIQEITSFEELKNEAILLFKEKQNLINENNYLKETLEWFKKQLFGKKSEKIIEESDKQLFFYFIEELEKPKEQLQTISSYISKKNEPLHDKIVLPSDLPFETTVIDIPEEEKTDPITKEALVKIGEEKSHKLAIKPAVIFIKEIIRPKYALPNNEGIKIAPMPDSIIPKCRADESLLAEILTKKYADHLPLYRIQEEFSRSKIIVPRKLMSNWVMKIGHALMPLYEEMKKRILESKNVFIDETPIKMKDSPKTRQAYMWILTGGKVKDPYYRIFDFRLNRNHEHAKDLLLNYTGTVHSDKYGAYQHLAEKKQFTWQPCFSHIRRKFLEAATDPPFTNMVLRKIRYLFLFEKIAWQRSIEERLRIRKEKEEPIIDKLIYELKDKLHNGKLYPKSNLAIAVKYFCSLIPYLKNYIYDPWAHLDNNVAERAIRPLAIGRKNWLFVGNEKAGKAAAVIISLTQTCRALNINPKEYFEDIFRRFMGHNYAKLYQLLPDEWALSYKK